MSTIIYGQPGCSGCQLTKNQFELKGIEYEYRDITTDTNNLDTVRALGYTSVPVIVTEDGDHWSGYRPDKIRTLLS